MEIINTYQTRLFIVVGNNECIQLKVEADVTQRHVIGSRWIPEMNEIRSEEIKRDY